MTHKQLITFVSQRSGVCTATVGQVLPAVFDIIRETVITGQNHGTVRLDGFGTFYAQNRKTNLADPGHPGQRIRGYKLTPRFSPVLSFKEEVLHEQVNPNVHAFQRNHSHDEARHQRNRKYHFRSEETKQRMKSIGRGLAEKMMSANRQRLQRLQNSADIKAQPMTREEMWKKKYGDDNVSDNDNQPSS